MTRHQVADFYRELNDLWPELGTPYFFGLVRGSKWWPRIQAVNDAVDGGKADIGELRTVWTDALLSCRLHAKRKGGWE